MISRLSVSAFSNPFKDAHEELDEPTALLLREFVDTARSNFGSWAAFWHCALDVRGDDRFCIPSSGMAVSCWAGGNPIVSSNCWTRTVPDISAGLAPPGWRAPNWRKAAAKHPADPGPLLRMASPQCLPRPPRPRAGPGIRSSGSIGIG